MKGSHTKIKQHKHTTQEEKQYADVTIYDVTIYFGKLISCSSKALLCICEVQTQIQSLMTLHAFAKIAVSAP